LGAVSNKADISRLRKDLTSKIGDEVDFIADSVGRNGEAFVKHQVKLKVDHLEGVLRNAIDYQMKSMVAKI